MSGVIKPGINSVIESAKYCLDAGADAILLITPYYSRPTQEGIYDYYKTIANSVDIPIIVYNIPARTGVDVNPQTLAQLSEISQIVGIKECNWDLGQFIQKIRLVGEKISVIAGSSPVAVEAMAMGAKGLITGSDNLIPGAWVKIYEACKRRDFELAKEIHRKYLPLFSVLASEPDPAPLKAALNMVGRVEEYVRSPILPIREDTRKKIQEVLKGIGML
jgi:4-hydroxy-tetrahydrodipicolinate synthase